MTDKFFISHSSQRKKDYVEPLRVALGEDMVVVDKFVFESGEQIRDEIERYISECRYFVYLISKEAFESKWIEDELRFVRDLIDEGKVLFYPVVIDADIDISDSRIKPWIKKSYITDGYPRPEVLARLLLKKYRKDQIASNCQLREINNLFLGRDIEMADLKNQMIDMRTSSDPMQPNTLIISGVPHLGRNRLLREFLAKEVKSGVNWTEFLQVSLASSDDGWMLAQELNEKVGVYSRQEISEKPSEPDIIAKLKKLILTLEKGKEYFIIEDDGAIVRRDGRLVDWFVELASLPELSRGLHFHLVSRYSPRQEMFGTFQSVICKRIHEIPSDSLTRLFKEYARIKEVDLGETQAQNYADRVKGHPSPVYKVVDRLGKGGARAAEKALRDSMAAIDKDFKYVEDEVSKEKGAIDVLNILARVVFISEDNIKEIVGEDVSGHLGLFDSFGLLSYSGPDNQNISLNSGLSDYLRRKSSGSVVEAQNKLRAFALRQLSNRNPELVDLSGYLAGIEQQISESPDSIPASALVPSMVLKAMIEAYYRGNNAAVVSMADQLIGGYNKGLYHDMERSIHYWLCSALARMADKRFPSEIEYFDEQGRNSSYSYNFLMGFYHRHRGRMENHYHKAKEYYMKAYAIAQSRRTESSIAKLLHEIWLVKNYLKENDAIRFAKECYETDPKNSFHIEAYFTSLVRSNNPDRETLNKLIEEMDASHDSHRRVITATMKVEYKYFLTHDISGLVSGIRKVLDEASPSYRSYPMRVFKELCEIGDMMTVYNGVKRDYPKVEVGDKDNMHMAD